MSRMYVYLKVVNRLYQSMADRFQPVRVNAMGKSKDDWWRRVSNSRWNSLLSAACIKCNPTWKLKGINATCNLNLCLFSCEDNHSVASLLFASNFSANYTMNFLYIRASHFPFKTKTLFRLSKSSYYNDHVVMTKLWR